MKRLLPVHRSVLFGATAFSILSLTAASPGWAQSAVASADQRTAMALTVYQGGFAMVQETRQATLPEGAAELVLPDLSDRLDLATIRLDAGPEVRVRSLAFNREILSSSALLRRAVGQQVRIARVNPATGEETFEDAEILAVAPDLVVRIGDRIETAPPGRIVFSSVPAGLRPEPGIVASVSSTSFGDRPVALSYLSDGVSWTASYVGRIAEGADTMELTAWALIDNQTATAFPAAQLSLIAGQVNRASVRPAPRQPIARALQAEVVADAVAPSATGPYYLYALPQTFDIAARQQTQVELLRSATVPVVRKLRTEGAPVFTTRAGPVTQPVMAQMIVSNESNHGLGVPMPAGLFSAFEQADGRDVFQGGATVTATPVGHEMTIDLGQSFDVTFERTVLAFNRSGARNENIDTTQRLTLKNGGNRTATVELVETFRGEWRILRSSEPQTQTSAFQSTWQVSVPPRGEAIVEYRAQMSLR